MKGVSRPIRDNDSLIVRRMTVALRVSGAAPDLRWTGSQCTLRLRYESEVQPPHVDSRGIAEPRYSFSPVHGDADLAIFHRVPSYTLC